MTYEQAVKQLQTLAVKKGIDYRLDRLNPVLDALGNPEKKLNTVIHVAGTNGKGSTIAFMQAMCREAGYSVGTFTSPHLASYTERITMNKTPISEDDFSDLFNHCKDVIQVGLTEFETLTMMALLYFSKKKPDICLLEVGLGGRLDATNVIVPDCSVITQIDYDHQAILGKTIEAITQEKAGIIKRGVPVVTTTMQHKKSMEIITQKATKKEARLYYETPVQIEKDWSLQGEHQGINASLALRAIKIVWPNIDEKAVKTGLKKAQIWGRFTTIKTNTQTLIIDGAHNAKGLAVLRQNMKNYLEHDCVTVIVGIHRSKSLDQLVPLIKLLGNEFYYCEFDTQFSHKIKDVRLYFKRTIKHYKLGDTLPKTSVVLITGSIYFIGNFYKEETKKRPILAALK